VFSWCTVAEKSAGIKEARGEVKPTNQLYHTHLQILNWFFLPTQDHII
jgi:hypothetical protein